MSKQSDYDGGLQVGREETIYRSLVVPSDWMRGWLDGQRERVRQNLPVAPAVRELLQGAPMVES